MDRVVPIYLFRSNPTKGDLLKRDKHNASIGVEHKTVRNVEGASFSIFSVCIRRAFEA